VFLLLTLSKIGFDIVIFTPGGVNCIENIINSQIVDIHRLDVINYNLKYKSSRQTSYNNSSRNSSSWIEKLFGKWSD
ncbi:YceG family protein, partial [Intestinibacter sp.]